MNAGSIYDLLDFAFDVVIGCIVFQSEYWGQGWNRWTKERARRGRDSIVPVGPVGERDAKLSD